MPVHVLAQVAIPYLTGIPEDVAVNTWSFRVNDDTGSDLAEVGAFIQTFYTGVRPLLSPVLDTEQVRVKMYRRSDPEPRSPIVDVTDSVGAISGGAQMPEEVAICFSFRGVLESGEPPARRRGRIYIGPLNTGTLDIDDPQNRSRVDLSAATVIHESYENAWAELTTAGNVHEVWSRADGEGFPVVQAWVDNAFDIQRRRGPAPTAREVRSAPF